MPNSNQMLVFVIVALVVVISPVLLIMSLNTLFGLGIALSIQTWASAAFLIGLIAGSKK